MEDPITIMTFNDESEAKICQGQLQAEGIDSFLKNEAVINAMTHMNIGLGGYQLQVSQKDSQRATEIIGN